MGFMDGRSPRLALLASELEASQNTAIRFLELRFGKSKPSGSVKWPREFDLEPLLDQIDRFLDAQDRAGVRIPLFTARAIVQAAREAGLATDDDDVAKITSAVEKQITDGEAAKVQQRSALENFLDRDPAGAVEA
jgi:hypothetical protein